MYFFITSTVLKERRSYFDEFEDNFGEELSRLCNLRHNLSVIPVTKQSVPMLINFLQEEPTLLSMLEKINNLISESSCKLYVYKGRRPIQITDVQEITNLPNGICKIINDTTYEIAIPELVEIC